MLYDQNDGYYAILLSLVMLKVVGDEFECDQMNWNQESLNLSLLSLLLLFLV